MAEQESAKVTFELVSPQELVVSETVDMVVIPGTEGDFGVLPGHTPLLSTMRPGSIDIWQAGKVSRRLFVEHGFAEVAEHGCTVLAESVIDLDEINSDEADKRLAKAHEAFNQAENPTDQKLATSELHAAEALAQAVEARSRDAR